MIVQIVLVVLSCTFITRNLGSITSAGTCLINIQIQ